MNGNTINIEENIDTFIVDVNISKMSFREIQNKIRLLESFQEILEKRKIEVKQEIDLYEEDDTSYEEEKLEEIKDSIKKVSDYLDKLYDFVSDSNTEKV